MGRNKNRKAWAKHLGKKDGEKRNKFGAQPTKIGDKTYPSKLEAAVAQQLKWRMKDGEFTEVKEQCAVDFVINGVRVCRNFVDFRAVTKDGEVWYIEAKGKETPVYKIQKQFHIAMLDGIEPGARYFVVKGSAYNNRWQEVEIQRL